VECEHYSKHFRAFPALYAIFVKVPFYNTPTDDKILNTLDDNKDPKAAKHYATENYKAE